MAAMRLASLTAGPTTVKSRRLGLPTLPKKTSPICRPRYISVTGRLSALRRSFSAATRSRAPVAAAMAAAQALPRSSRREHGQHPVADQLQHIAALGLDGGDHRLGVIVQQRDDMGGLGVVGDPGEAAQIAEPEHGLDPVGDAALDPPAQHLAARLAAEIGLHQGLGDAPEGGAFHRHGEEGREPAQRQDLGLAEALGPIRLPAGIDAIHVAHRALGGEFVHDAEVVGIAGGEAMLRDCCIPRPTPGSGGSADGSRCP